MSKITWRRRWFQIHKWIGLLLVVLIVPISLSGAALVWQDQLDALFHPARHHVSGDATLAPSAYASAARVGLHPDERIASLSLPEDGGPVTVTAVVAAGARAKAGPPSRTTVYLDPPTARVLDTVRGDGLFRFLHRLHGSLTIPGAGRTIVGWIGVALALSCFTGLWLWWPTVGRWSRGLRYRRHRHTDANLHHLAGFWIALPLFVIALTGVWISFPGVFGGGGAKRAGPSRAAMMRALPLDAPAQPVDMVVARAKAIRAGAWRSVTWPTDVSADWGVRFAGGANVKVADDGGVAVAAAAQGPGGTMRLMRRIHDGDDMGLVWQTIVVLTGLLPTLLGVTGIIMWWRARGWRAKAARRV